MTGETVVTVTGMISYQLRPGQWTVETHWTLSSTMRGTSGQAVDNIRLETRKEARLSQSSYSAGKKRDGRSVRRSWRRLGK